MKFSVVVHFILLLANIKKMRILNSIHTLIFLLLFQLIGCTQTQTKDNSIDLKNNDNEFVNDTSEIKADEYLYSTSFTPDCFNSAKLKKIIPKTDYFKSFKISEKEFNSLNAYEHFVHSFNYPEWYYQSCSLFGYYNDYPFKIPALLKRQGEGLRMSTRQEEAIIQNRDSTIILIEKCILDKKNVNDEYKRKIISLRAFELIPTLIKTIQSQEKIKDPFILTTLCLLMRFEYEPFKKTEIYDSLYPTDSLGFYWSEEAYEKSIPFTYKNYNDIINFSNDYYDLKKAKLSEFVTVKGGNYTVGEEGHSTNPIRTVEIKSFQISRYEITNKQFQQFVKNTGYITLAEKNKDAFVFRIGLDEFEWIQDSTANWKFPNGVSEGGIEEKMNHPVTCISYIDASAYCSWANVRLPTIEEWEVSSLGGKNNQKYFFGDSLSVISEYANIWHGKTHLMKYQNEDYITTSPVGAFKPNPFGIYDIYGNVFEFCSNVPEAFKKYENIASTRGGSWWCSKNACGFFNSIDIGRVQKEASFSNNGFRVVL